MNLFFIDPMINLIQPDVLPAWNGVGAGQEYPYGVNAPL